MTIDLASMVRRIRNPRRSQIVVRDIIPPAVLASNLYTVAYAPIVNAWASALPKIIAEYERSLAAITTDSPANLQARLDAASSDIERLFILLDAGLRDWTLGVERWQRGKWRGAVLSATGVDLQTMIGPENVKETLDRIIAWNVSLIRDVSAEAKRRISNAVFAGLNQRKPANEVAAEIREAVTMSRDRARRIASDQLSKLTSALAAERRREAGLTIYRYRHSGKLHPRSWHQARNGKLYADNPADAERVINGETVNAPIPEDDRAGIPPFCGCREQGVIDLS